MNGWVAALIVGLLGIIALPVILPLWFIIAHVPVLQNLLTIAALIVGLVVAAIIIAGKPRTPKVARPAAPAPAPKKGRDLKILV